jgi:hypothetical protein
MSVKIEISQEIRDAARDAVIGKKYAAHVIYSTAVCSAVVDTYCTSPQTDWSSALETVVSRAEDWVSNTARGAVQVVNASHGTCNLFAIAIHIESGDGFIACYTIDLAEWN